MNKNYFTKMKCGMGTVVLALVCSLDMNAQSNNDAISTLINANCNLKVEVKNDAVYPWVVDNGDLKCGNAGKANSTSTLTLTYDSKNEQFLDFSSYRTYGADTVIIDNKKYVLTANNYSQTHHHYYIAAGHHTIQFVYTLQWAESYYNCLLRNISIREFDWLDISLSRAGMLGTEVLYKVDVLDDVVQLRIHGLLDNTDWEKIHLMKNLRDIDLTDATITSIPNSEFNACPYLETALLPESLTSIGESAFANTALSNIIIPANVTTIGGSAFSGVNNLTTVTIPQMSSLTNLGGSSFRNCTSLQSFQLPNGITELKSYTFDGCTALSSIVLPNALKSIGNTCFRNTKALNSIEFPQTLTYIGGYAFCQSGIAEVVLPQNLTTLGFEAFSYCNSLKYVELPVTPDPQFVDQGSGTGFYHPFAGCTALEKVVCPSATPPLYYRDYNPFSGVDLNKVTLVVPAFAVVDYKLEAQWHLFGNIVGDAEPTQIKLASTLSLTNDRRPAQKTDITMTVPGRLVVSGNAPLEIGKLTFNTNYDHNSVSAQLLSQTPAITVDQIQTSFYATSGRWYFIAPMHNINVNDISHSVADASFVFRYYNSQNRAANGPTGSWQNLLDNTLKAGQGYILQTNKAGWIYLPATATGKDAVLVTDDVTTTLNSYNAANSANANWNYVGNPYPCFYDTYYMDLTAPITVRDYSNNTYRAYSPIDDGYVLRPMEAFFVQKPTGQNQILFQQEGRQLTSEVQHSTNARKIENDSRQLFDIEITDGTHSDRTRIVMNPQASLTYEPAVDATKFISQEADIPQLYSIDDEGNLLAINERPIANGTVRMGLQANQSGTFTINLCRGTGGLWLTDAENGQVVDLSQSNYTFILYNTAAYDSRFTLSFGISPTVVTSVKTSLQQKEQVYDLQGRRLNGQPQKGIYLKNGKKQIVK